MRNKGELTQSAFSVMEQEGMSMMSLRETGVPGGGARRATGALGGRAQSRRSPAPDVRERRARFTTFLYIPKPCLPNPNPISKTTYS